MDARVETLAAHDVEFIVVGGMAAALQGAPVHTLDLDVVYAFAELNAVFRGDPPKIKPNRSHLESAEQKLLETDHGVLDVLATIEENTKYEVKRRFD